VSWFGSRDERADSRLEGHTRRHVWRVDIEVVGIERELVELQAQEPIPVCHVGRRPFVGRDLGRKQPKSAMTVFSGLVDRVRVVVGALLRKHFERGVARGLVLRLRAVRVVHWPPGRIETTQCLPLLRAHLPHCPKA
jgi:hypothetical protein